MKILEILFLIIILSNASCMAQHDKLDEELDAILNKTVPFIYADDLKKKVGEEDLVLLDIRTKEEFNTSFIPGARFIEYDDFTPQEVDQIPRNKTIVLYCAVGYRSEKVGEQLMEMGFTNVFNLYGGIFEWKNEGYDVVAPDGNITDSVHTYNEAWSKYLKKGKGIYE